MNMTRREQTLVVAVAGLAIVLHPDNLRDPSPMRMNPEVPQCGYAPTRREALHVPAGGTYRDRYRLLLFDGPPDEHRLDALAEEFREPLRATARLLEDP